MCVCVHEFSVCVENTDGIVSSAAGVTGSLELPDTDAGNLT